MIRARDTYLDEHGETVGYWILDYYLDIEYLSVDDLIGEYLDHKFYNTPERRKQAIEDMKKGFDVKLGRSMPKKVSDKINNMSTLKKILVDFSIWRDEGHTYVDSKDYQYHEDAVDNFLEYRNNKLKKAENQICNNCNYTNKDFMACLLRKCEYLSY